MGKQDVAEPGDEESARAFVKALLGDVRTLARMLEDGSLFDTAPRRIGAEQEMFLVDAERRPALLALEVLRAVNEPRLTTELALFNLEANASPRELTGSCLRDMEHEVTELVGMADQEARARGARVLLAGILPTLRRTDLSLATMTPVRRYRALNDALRAARGGDFHIAIQGIDEVDVTHDNVMFEACNTSFQVHLQVAPAEFARFYNVAQLATAPVLAAAVNSPLLFGSRLWHETRVALFQSSIDERSGARNARGLKPRVSFGEQWVRESVLEVFQEQIARFRAVLAVHTDEDSDAVYARGEAPPLTALCVHNGTVYRWNRAVYGTHAGRAHLRIENRVLPSGPTILDEMANAAFFIGLVTALAEDLGDPQRQMEFSIAKHNFLAAAQHGVQAQLTWVDGIPWKAPELVTQRLLPLAREGLLAYRVDEGDVDRYLGVIEARLGAGRTGASWVLDAFAGLGDETPVELRELRIVSAMLEHQEAGRPVHEWPRPTLATVEQEEEWRRSLRRVGQFMTTDLFTVRVDDLVDLAASVMDWEHIKHVPVEDGDGRLLGLVTHRELLRLVARGTHEECEPVVVRDIMIPDPVTVGPDTPTLRALELMREGDMGCLPVIEDGRLVGIVTQADLIRVASGLLERFLSE
jgi:CBS domain-containing protein